MEVNSIYVMDMGIFIWKHLSEASLSLGLGMCKILLSEGKGERCVKGWIGKVS